MKLIVIQVREETVRNLRALAVRCTDEHRGQEGFTSHGLLTVSKLLAMLAEDAAIDFMEVYMTRMHNPPHPGEVLREYLGDVTVADAATRLGVGRVTLQRVVTGAAGISPDMAYRLASAFGTSPELWAGMQMQYDLHQDGHKPAGKLGRFEYGAGASIIWLRGLIE